MGSAGQTASVYRQKMSGTGRNSRDLWGDGCLFAVKQLIHWRNIKESNRFVLV